MSTPTLEQQITQIVMTLLKNKGDYEAVAPGDSLVISGRLRSMNIIELASILESEFGLDFGTIGFNQYQFDSIEKITKMARAHQS
jgi:acyl carrier protein